MVSWESRRGEEQEEPPLSLIIHPSKSSSQLGGAGSPKPLWRKRETVRQERTVHYTTIDASGEQQVCILLNLDLNSCLSAQLSLSPFFSAV